MKKRMLGASLLCALFLASCAPDVSSESSGEGETSTPPVVSTPEETSSDALESSSSDSSGGGSTNTGISVDNWDGIIRVYYRSAERDEAEKNIYIWSESMGGLEFEFNGVDEEYGVYRDFSFASGYFAGKINENFYFIIKNPGTWDGQSSDTVVRLADFADYGEIINERRWIYIYAIDGEGSDIDCFPTRQDALGDTIATTYLLPDFSGIRVEGSAAFDRIKIYGLSPKYYGLSVLDQRNRYEEFVVYDQHYEDEGAPTAIDIQLEGGVDPRTTYRVEGYFKSNPTRMKKKYATPYRIYDTDKFINEFTADDPDLGVNYTPEATTFKVWAPTSARVRLYIYDYGTPSTLVDRDFPNYRQLDSRSVYTLEYLGQGVYGITIDGDLNGKYYKFNLYYDETSHLSIDPYAKAAGINGLRGAILDFDDTDPEGWGEVEFADIESPTELTVYEAHIRDLTIDDTWNTSDPTVKRGTYRAFVEPGTTYNGVTTGFDSLKEMGITAIQLLPIFDQDNDERTYDYYDADGNFVETRSPEYNWGYNPQNYNVPEGSYSDDPYDAVSRIKELKYLIQQLSEAGIRTIMDVVYNHVSSVANHPFQTFAPRYYFRYTEDGYLINDTGVNNTVNTDRVMASRFVVDSVHWWAEEYKIMGFRFDLMGVLDTNTMRRVKDDLYDLNEDIVVYGEGWTGGSSSASSPSDIANVYAKLGDNGKGSVGVFNDCVRDGMKGNTVWANVIPSTGHFMDSASPSEDAIWNSATMYIGQNRARAQQGLTTPPEMSVNYISCHDNYTLYDQLNYQLHGQLNADKDHLDAIEATIAATATVLSSEGIAFIHGGEEIFRTKLIKEGDPYFETMVESYGAHSNETSSWIAGDGCPIDSSTWLVRNSYAYGDEVNGYKWDRKYQYKEYFDKYVDAIHERQQMIEEGYLGHSLSEINAGSVSCFANGEGTPGIGAYFQNGQGGTMIVLLGGRCGESVSINIPAAARGQYEIVYSSLGRTQATLSVGEAVSVGQYEALLLKKA